MAGRSRKAVTGRWGDWDAASPPAHALALAPDPPEDKRIRPRSHAPASRTPPNTERHRHPETCRKSEETPSHTRGWETGKNRPLLSQPNGWVESSSSVLLHPASDYARGELPGIFCLNLRWSLGVVDRLDSGVEVDKDLARFGAFTGTQNTSLFQNINDAGCAGVTEPQSPLQQRR